MLDSFLEYFLGPPPTDPVLQAIYFVFKCGIGFYFFDQLFGLFRMVGNAFKMRG